MVTGIDPQSENQLSRLEEGVVKGHYFSNNKDVGALLGEGLAEKLKVGVNDTIVLLGQGYQGNIAAGKFPVKGILHFGVPQLNQGSVYITLPVAQQWLSADGLLSAYVIGIDRADILENETLKLRSLLGNDYEVMSWKEMMPEINDHIKGDTVNFYIYIGVLYLIVTFGIFSTILMMANERTYEFGLLLSIGMKKGQLGLMMLGESFMLTTIGTIAGMLLSLPIVKLLEKYPMRIGGNTAAAYIRFGFEPIFPTVTKASIFINQGIIVLIIALLLGIYPVYYIYRLNTLKAMRK
jgi:ABC-type lipoprotein release transport system permease subunit